MTGEARRALPPDFRGINIVNQEPLSGAAFPEPGGLPAAGEARKEPAATIREALLDSSNALVPGTMTEKAHDALAVLDSLLVYIKQLEGELEDEHRAIERAWAERNAETEKAVAAEAQVKQLEGERDAKDRENVEAMTNSVRNLGAMRRWRERAEAAGRENERLREALETILSELGVPGDDYAAPVTNAVEIALAALAARTEEPR